MESVRRAEARDLDALVELEHALHQELAPTRGGAIWQARDARDLNDDLRGAFRALLSDPNALVLVGSIDEAVVAFAVVVFETLRTGARLARVTELFALPEARAVGVGEAVAAMIITAARDRGCSGIDAPALPGNREAKNFFERQGFTARMLTMHKPLS